MMATLYEIIKKLQKTPGSNDKIRILKEHTENAQLKWYLRQAMCPSINYYLTSKTFPNSRAVGDEEFTYSVIGLLANSLSNREITGNEAKLRVASMLDSLNEEGQELLRMMLLKDIRAGIGVSTVNKVWPDLCLQVPYQRCSLPTERTLKHFPDGKLAIVQLKGDGMFAAMKRSTKEMFTRNGSKFPTWLASYLLQYPNKLEDGVFEGELLCSRAGKLLPRQEGNGVLNSVLQGGELPQGVDIEYHVWNELTEEHWVAGRAFINYDISFNCCGNAVKLLGSPRIKLIEHAYFESLEQANAFNEIQLSKGLEGSVMKTLSHKWKSGTSSECVKLKKIKEVDLLWVSSVEGEGRNSGRLGAMLLKSSCGKLEVKCGTGFSDAEREMLWDSKPELPCIVTVAANDVINSKGKESASLFLPRFIELRKDKDEADSLERIVEIFA
jgi:DNA ligase-1